MSTVDDLARIWAYTGMQTSDKKPKPALATWDAWLQAEYRASGDDRKGGIWVDSTPADRPDLFLSQRLVLVVINNAHQSQHLSISVKGLDLAGRISGEQSTADSFWNALMPADVGENGLVQLDVPGLSVTSLAVPVSIEP